MTLNPKLLIVLPLLLNPLLLGCDEDTFALPDAGTDSTSDQSSDTPTTIDFDTSTSSPSGQSDEVYGETHSGQYHLGPVDFAETEWHNACAPAGGYRDELTPGTGLGGEYLVGVSNANSASGGVCDACIFIEAANGNSIIARVVTYGVTNEDGDLDVSPSVFEALNTDEYPRSMSWTFSKCPEAGTLRYEFQTGANPWWTSLWVRNPKVPITKAEVQSTNHADFYELSRQTDGTLNDGGGFGEGPFTLRLTGMNGQIITEDFSGFAPGELVVSTKQFD